MVIKDIFQKKESLLLRITATLCFLGVAVHVAGYFMPSGLLWGINYFAFLPIYVLLLYVLCTLAVIPFIMAGKADTFLNIIAEFMQKHQWMFLLIICSMFTAFAFLFQIEVPLLGDSFIIIKNYYNVFLGSGELWPFRSPLAVYYFSTIIRLTGWVEYPAILNAFLVGEIALGIGFLICIFFLIKNVFTSPLTQLTAFLFMICRPFMQIFFGYVEVYSVLLFGLSLFFLIVTLFIKGRIHFFLVIICFIVMALSHLMSLILAPVMLYLGYLEYKRKGYKELTLSFFIGVLVSIITILITQVNITTIANITPHSNFLSIGDSRAPYQAYTLLSIFHGTEILNMLALIAPLSFLFLGLGLYCRRNTKLFHPFERVLLISTLLVVVFISAAKFDLGMAKDWDISASLMVIVSLCAIVLFLERNDERFLRSIHLATATIALTILPWFYLNSTVDDNVKRTESFMDKRVLSREGHYLAMMHLTSHYRNLNDIPNISRTMEKYLSLYPTDVWVYHLYTRALIETGSDKNPKTEEVFSRWLKLAPNDSTVRQEYSSYALELGTSYYQEGRHDSARLQFEKAISLSPSSWVAYNNLGLVYFQQHDFVRALPNFQKSIQLNPNYSTAYLNIAGVYSQTSKIDSAIAVLKKVISFDSHNLLAYENLSKAYYQSGDKDEAIVILKEAARLGSTTAQYILSMQGNNR